MQYAECLELVAERDKLGGSELHPVLASDIWSVEHKLKAQLPGGYEDFLREVGCGVEHGGLACWPHLDITRPGNVLEVSQAVYDSGNGRRPPRGFLVIYDSFDGEMFGFVRQGTCYGAAVYVWSSEDMSLQMIADSFEDFLDYITDCSDDELRSAGVIS